MPSFTKGSSSNTTPFGRNAYLRSTKGNLFESYTLAAATVPAVTIDGNAGQKVLQPGTALAKITSGTHSGKVGPFQADATDGRGDEANLVGINDTFAPWQLLERDIEVGVLYKGTCVQGWCFELDAAGAQIVLTNATADALRGTKGLDVNFK